MSPDANFVVSDFSESIFGEGLFGLDFTCPVIVTHSRWPQPLFRQRVHDVDGCYYDIIYWHFVLTVFISSSSAPDSGVLLFLRFCLDGSLLHWNKCNFYAYVFTIREFNRRPRIPYNFGKDGAASVVIER